MKLLIVQPKLEKNIDQLEAEMQRNPAADAIIVPEGYLNENVDQACRLAKMHNKMIIGGYRRMQEHPKDRAIIINRSGEIVLDRVKYSRTQFVTVEGLKMGHILCDEIVVQGVNGNDADEADLIIHPIGTGMFSEAQFDEWTNEAKNIAVAYNTMVIGTSHADGTYRDSDISIPIAYCFDRNGNEVFLSKNDTRTRMLDTQTKSVYFPQGARFEIK